MNEGEFIFYSIVSSDDDSIIFNSKVVNEIDGAFDGPGTVVLGKDGAYIFR